MNLQFSHFINQTILQKIKLIQLIPSVSKQLLALNKTVRYKICLILEMIKKMFPEALRTKCDDSLISCG